MDKEIVKILNDAKTHIQHNNAVFALYSLRQCLDCEKISNSLENDLRNFVNQNSHRTLNFMNLKLFAFEFNALIIKNNLESEIHLLDLESLNVANFQKYEIKNFESIVNKIRDPRVFTHKLKIYDLEWSKNFLKINKKSKLDEINKKYMLSEEFIGLYSVLVANSSESGVNDFFKRLHANDWSKHNQDLFRLRYLNDKTHLNEIKSINFKIRKINNVENYFRGHSGSRLPLDLLDYLLIALRVSKNNFILSDGENQKNIIYLKEILQNNRNDVENIISLLDFSIKLLIDVDDSKSNAYANLKNIIISGREIENIKEIWEKFTIIIKVILFLIEGKTKEKKLLSLNNYVFDEFLIKITIKYIIENDDWWLNLNMFVRKMIESRIINDYLTMYSSSAIDNEEIIFLKNLDFKKSINEIRDSILLSKKIGPNFIKFNYSSLFRNRHIKEHSIINFLVLKNRIDSKTLKLVKDKKTLTTIMLDEEKNSYTNFAIIKVKTQESISLQYQKKKIYHDNSIQINHTKNTKQFKKIEFSELVIGNLISGKPLTSNKMHNHIPSIFAIIDIYLDEKTNFFRKKTTRVCRKETLEKIIMNKNKIFSKILNGIDWPTGTYNFSEVLNSNFKFIDSILKNFLILEKQ